MKHRFALARLKELKSKKNTKWCPLIQKTCVGTKCISYQEADLVKDSQGYLDDPHYKIVNQICLWCGQNPAPS